MARTAAHCPKAGAARGACLCGQNTHARPGITSQNQRNGGKQVPRSAGTTHRRRDADREGVVPASVVHPPLPLRHRPTPARGLAGALGWGPSRVGVQRERRAGVEPPARADGPGQAGHGQPFPTPSSRSNRAATPHPLGRRGGGDGGGGARAGRGARAGQAGPWAGPASVGAMRRPRNEIRVEKQRRTGRAGRRGARLQPPFPHPHQTQSPRGPAVGRAAPQRSRGKRGVDCFAGRGAPQPRGPHGAARP